MAFSDKVILYINDDEVESYDSAGQEAMLNDALLTAVSGCNWYIDKNISYSMQSAGEFEVRFEVIYKANIPKRHIAIFDFQIDCISDVDDAMLIDDVSKVAEDKDCELGLISKTFAPRSKLLFAFNYKKCGRLQGDITIQLNSDSLALDCLIHINAQSQSNDQCMVCDQNKRKGNNQCISCKLGDQIAINIPSYRAIQMHKSFDSEYVIQLSSSDVILKQTKYKIKRTDFMNISLELHPNLFWNDTLRISSFTINNRVITQNASFIRLYCPTLEIDALIKIFYVTSKCFICDYKKCYLCFDGMPISLPNGLAKHALTMSSNDTLLTANQYDIVVNNIFIEYNHWVRLTEIDNESPQIVSSSCPNDYCCPTPNGCYYNEAKCALNRDANIPLCGGCLPGYSEVFGSVNCRLCNEDKYEYLAFGLLIGFIYAICMLFIVEYNGENQCEPTPVVALENSKFSFHTLILYDSIQALFISLFRPIAYFYQSIGYLLANSIGLAPALITPLLSIFSVDLNMLSYEFCFLSHLESLQEEMWTLFVPLCIFVSIFLFYICGLFNDKYKPNVAGMVWFAMLLTMNTVIICLLKVLACKQITDGVIVHFYFLQYECFDALWWLALIGIALIFLFWISLFFLLFQMDSTERQSSSLLNHESVISPYKDTYWFWKFVVLSRRILISAVITFKYLFPQYFCLVLSSVLIIYLSVHLKLKPFRFKRINNIESLLLSMLICSVVVVEFSEESFANIFVLIALLFPVFLVMIRIYSVIKIYVFMKSAGSELSEHQQRKLLNVIDRLPEHRKHAMLKIMYKTMPYIRVPQAIMEQDDDAEGVQCDDKEETNTFIPTYNLETRDDEYSAGATILTTITDFRQTPPDMTLNTNGLFRRMRQNVNTAEAEEKNSFVDFTFMATGDRTRFEEADETNAFMIEQSI